MDKVQRIIPSMTAWAQGASPYASTRQTPKTPGAPAPAASPCQEGLALKHAYSGWVPHDIGIPAPAHADEEAMGASFPPPDIDEAAGFIGRIRMLGPIVGRAMMLFGGVWAMWATVQAAFGLQEDSAQRQSLKALANAHLALPETRNAHPLGRALSRAATESAVSWAANLVLLPGSLGMGINLLASAELGGHFLPLLVPFADAAMLPAVACMAVYGGIIAAKALYDIAVSFKNSDKLTGHARRPIPGLGAQDSQAVYDLLLAKERSRRLWDTGLAAAGTAQAVGAILQYAIGPAFLAVLLPGTFALGFGKLGKAKALGHSIYLPMPDLGPLCRNAADLGRALVTSHRNRQALTELKRDARDVQVAVCGALGKMIADAPCDHTELASQVQALALGMGDLALFAPFALRVAQDTTLPRTPGFTNDGSEYTITPNDVVALISHQSGTEAVQHVRQLYSHARDVLTDSGLFNALRHEAVLADVLMQTLS